MSTRLSVVRAISAPVDEIFPLAVIFPVTDTAEVEVNPFVVIPAIAVSAPIAVSVLFAVIAFPIRKVPGILVSELDVPIAISSSKIAEPPAIANEFSPDALDSFPMAVEYLPDADV